jgi:hypothetical protein
MGTVATTVVMAVAAAAEAGAAVVAAMEAGDHRVILRENALGA